MKRMTRVLTALVTNLAATILLLAMLRKLLLRSLQRSEHNHAVMRFEDFDVESACSSMLNCLQVPLTLLDKLSECQKDCVELPGLMSCLACHMTQENRRRNLVAVRKIAAKDPRMKVPDQDVLDRTQHFA